MSFLKDVEGVIYTYKRLPIKRKGRMSSRKSIKKGNEDGDYYDQNKHKQNDKVKKQSV